MEWEYKLQQLDSCTEPAHISYFARGKEGEGWGCTYKSEVQVEDAKLLISLRHDGWGCTYKSEVQVEDTKLLTSLRHDG